MTKNYWKKVFDKKNHDYLKKSNKVLKLWNKYKFESLAFQLSKIVYNSDFVFFQKLIKIIVHSLKLNNCNKVSIADYGSGNGFILFYLKKKYNIKKIYSFEIVKNYLTFQKKIIKNAKFKQVNPKNKKIPLKSNTINYFISSSAFQYLKNLNQAKSLLKEFVRTSKNGILILDILDYEKKKDHLKHKFLISKLSKKAYKKKFKNLKLIFYKKNFFNFLKSEKKVNKLIFFKMPKTSIKKRYSYCLFIKLDDLEAKSQK